VGDNLSHEVVAGAGDPGSWLYMAHGIYGAGRNWRSLARRLVDRRPEWGVVLVDLRLHGDSTAFEPPHTIAAAADDLRGLADGIGPAASALLGHSFGGKVVLRLAEFEPPDLRQVWVIDSTPSIREPAGTALDMLEAIRALPREFETREALIEALAARGFDRSVAAWMATNLVRVGAGYTWRFDLTGVASLLADFFRTDLWTVLERPPAGVEIHLVRATASNVLDTEDRSRIRSGTDPERVFLHEIEGGHWLNADNPAAIVDLLAEHLP